MSIGCLNGNFNHPYGSPCIMVDIDGPKGANTRGKDIFAYSVYLNSAGDFKVMPFGCDWNSGDGCLRQTDAEIENGLCHTETDRANGGYYCLIEIFKNML